MKAPVFDICEKQKEMVAQTIVNEYLEATLPLLRAGTPEALEMIMEEIERTNERFNRYGIDVVDFLGPGRP